MKKALILYDSVYGNTKKVAMSIGRGLESGGVSVDVININEFKIEELTRYDFIAIGGPTHYHGASKNMKLFLSNLKHLRLNHKIGVAFETKADSSFSGSAAKRIKRYLNKMNVRVIHPTITCIVLNKEGPLKNSTPNALEQIGLNLSEKINNG
jgi:flavorubredoxin